VALAADKLEGRHQDENLYFALLAAQTDWMQSSIASTPCPSDAKCDRREVHSRLSKLRNVSVPAPGAFFDFGLTRHILIADAVCVRNLPGGNSRSMKRFVVYMVAGTIGYDLAAHPLDGKPHIHTGEGTPPVQISGPVTEVTTSSMPTLGDTYLPWS
jgi:hypothetical protein